MSFGIKVSKPNIDVTSARDRDVSFSSDYIHPKIWKAGKISGTSQTINHPFGYPITVVGYILNNSKYFPQYDLNPLNTSGFENSVYGKITSNASNIQLSCDSANQLVYVAFVDPATPTPNVGSKLDKDKVGLKLSETDIDVRTAIDRLLSVTSGFQMLNIVQQGDVTISMGQLGPTESVEEDTATSDVTHKLSYAAHFILYNDSERGGINYTPAPSGFGPGQCATSTEVYIDNSKIRFRVSRIANGAAFFPATCSATDFKFKYQLTNYKLPE